MKRILTPLFACLLLILSSSLFATELAPERNRLVILADMGNEPDEEQQMMHLLMYANEFDIEGLIAVTGKYLRKDPQSELFFKLIEGYEKVVDNLRLHASGWPDASFLQSKVSSGQFRYGIEDVRLGRSSPGSRQLEELFTKPDPRPIYIVVNAGSNTLAQALIDFEAKHSKKLFNATLSKLRVYENGSQDNAGAWICNRYPTINWIRSNYQTYCYGGPSIDSSTDNSGTRNNLGPHTWQPYAYSGVGQHQWALEHIKGDHGPLGALWPIRQFGQGRVSFLEGGGTVPWLGLINKGLYDINNPHWGGWSGLFTREKEKNYYSKHSDIKVDEEKLDQFYVFKETEDTWANPETGETYENNLFSPIWRWRRAFFNDFAARMDWCENDYESANHNPIALIRGDPSNAILLETVKAGSEFKINANDTMDPDGDTVFYSWYFYPEAGTYPEAADIEIARPDRSAISFTVPSSAKGKEIHLILEVQDNGKGHSLFDYRRVVLSVE